ncbi:IS200/IS605 family transposase [Candidatus Pacearchaeota archaeon CG10_big_fil_rev_8_21_14_0_10_34_12]|nr:MAG: IS200/IS605 family transposase [Candidatus Pacearchaeota archaeon CG10_big_fil_rev_8_21_14_0_10_34_12]
MYQHNRSSVGGNRKHIQITPKYRYKMMRQEKLKVFCRVAIEEACKKHKISVEIIKVMEEHVHMIVDIPRTMTDAKALQIVKGLSSYILFRICPNLRKRYPKGHFWSEGYFCDGVGESDFARTWVYIENQELHHH